MAIQALSKPTINIRPDNVPSKHNADRIRARASTFKLQHLNDRYGDIGVAIPYLAPPSRSPAPSLSRPRPASPSTSQKTHPPPPPPHALLPHPPPRSHGQHLKKPEIHHLPHPTHGYPTKYQPAACIPSIG